jgi:hypothetical protein
VLSINRLSLPLTAILTCALILAASASFCMVKADSTPVIPAVPQFNLTLEQGYIIITIKNQPISGETLYYNARAKLHTDTNWAGSFYIDDSIGTFDCIQQSTSNFTVITFSVPVYAIDKQLDIQVKAVPRYPSQVFVPDYSLGYFRDDGYYETRMVIGTSSGWSNIQTITVTLPTPTPFVSEPPPPIMYPTSPPYPNHPSQTSPTNSPAAIPPQASASSGAPVDLSWIEITFILLVAVIAGLVATQVLLWRKIKAK